MQAIYSRPTAAASEHGEDCEYLSWDDSPIYYRHWQNRPGIERRALVLLHDHQEHSDYYRDLAADLAQAGCCVFAWDARGYGRTPATGSPDDFHGLVRDLDRFAAHLRADWQLPAEQIIVIGQGLGAALATCWIHDYAPTLAGVILGALPLRVRSLGRLSLRRLALLQALNPTQRVPTYLPLRRIISDRTQAALRRDDPFIDPHLPARLVLTQQAAMRRLASQPQSLDLPVLMLGARDDRILDQSSNRSFFDRISAMNKIWKLLSGPDTAVFHGGDREQAIALSRSFITDVFDERGAAGKIYVGHGFGQGFAAMQGPPNTPERGEILRKLSRGACLARDTGYYAGHHIDYLLRDQAGGISALHRAADRHHLSQPKAEALRRRYDLLTNMLAGVIAQRRREQQMLQVVQLGGAPGRCLRESLAAAASTDARINALCIDGDAGALESGRQQCLALGLNSLGFAKHDPLDAATLTELPFAPDLLILDGVLESTTDTGACMRLLRAASARLANDARLIVGNRLAHPDIPAEGDAWHPRPAAELHRLLRLAGFEPERTEVESGGVHQLILARKRKRSPGSRAPF